MSVHKKVQAIEDSLFSGQASHTYIQWKGTAVCMDFKCVCGLSMHFDAAFMYFVKCPACSQIYAVGSRVVMVPVNESDADSAEIHVLETSGHFE